MIGVNYTSTDPDTAAIVANRVAELYIEAGHEKKRADNAAEFARLDGRIAELKADIERSGAAVRDLVRQRADAMRPPSDTGDAERHLQQLERAAGAKAQLYHMLLERQKEIRNQREIITPDARILSLAVTPDRPSSPNPFLFILPALVLFLIFGSMVGVLLERLDRGLRSEREISEVLGVPCVGLVPEVAGADRICLLHGHLADARFTAYAEALRSIAASIQFASPRRQSKVVLITSSLPGEGKSTLAVWLSACIALPRERVLLIDLDFGQASLLGQINGGVQPAVNDLLLDSASSAEVIRPLPELGIDYLPVNQCSAHALMRFAATELPRLISKLRDSYDCIVMKGPPVLGRSETRLLAAVADEILFLVKWGSTRREFAQNALSLLRNDVALSWRRRSNPSAP